MGPTLGGTRSRVHTVGVNQGRTCRLLCSKIHCRFREIASRAAGLHLGLDVALKMLDFFDDLGRFDKLDSGTRFVRDRHMI